MGDPRKLRKTYSTPYHLWQGSRISDEKKIEQEYGLKNNREIWKSSEILANFRDQAKKLIGTTGDEADNRKKTFLNKLMRMGVLETDSLDDVLALDLKNILDRRLQTRVYKLGIANTPKEARQMIVHGLINFKGNITTPPGLIVYKEDENTISYTGPPRKVVTRPEHAETADEKEEAKSPKPEKTEDKPAEDKTKEKSPESKKDTPNDSNEVKKE